MGHDLDDLAVVEPGRAQGLHVQRRDAGAAVHHLDRERQCRGGPRIARPASLRLGHFLSGRPGLPAKAGVGRKAV